MLYRIRISHWLIFFMVVMAGLTVIISGVGMFSVKTVQHKLSDSILVVQQRLEQQNQCLQKKSEQFHLVNEITEARSLKEMQKLPTYNTSDHQKASDALTEAINRLAAAQRDYLALNEKQELLNQKIKGHLETIHEQVNKVVSAIEKRVDTQAGDALTTLTQNVKSQRKALLVALSGASANPTIFSNAR